MDTESRVVEIAQRCSDFAVDNLLTEVRVLYQAPDYRRFEIIVRNAERIESEHREIDL